MDSLFNIFPFLFVLVFVFVFGVIIFGFVRSFSQWKKNNNSPRLTVDTKVVAKRTQVSHNGTGEHHHHSTSYYVTFEVESGDRMELHVDGYQYGMLVEGDQGKLTFQGTRFLDFQRQWNP